MQSDTSLSFHHRNDTLKKMSETKYDILVIGGGITGAGIALDAASRKLKVALVEKQDFAAGTSSRSTKLIHGGLRYLKQLQFKLVYEVGRERKILYRNAPHLIFPEKMLLPLIKGGTYQKWTVSFALWLYEMLARVKKEEKRMMFSKEQTLKQEPLLNKDFLTGSGLYVEYRTDDSRLTIEVMKTACEYGADSINYTEVTGFIYENKMVKGVVIKDNIENKEYKIFAKHVVNATGPWVDMLRKKDEPAAKTILHLTKGVHLVVPFKRLPIKQSVYFDTDDNRMIFAIPRGKTTYIGTTDTDYKDTIENPLATTQDISYLLDATNKMFPAADLSKNDVVASWAGIRPLIQEEGKGASEISRKDEIKISTSGMITIAGGKLTGYREMAQKVVDKIIQQSIKSEHKKFIPCRTQYIKLSGGNFKTPFEIKKYCKTKCDENKQHGFAREDITDFVNRYGKNADCILQKAVELKIKNNASPLLSAEVWYGITYEAVTNLNDFLIRRTGKLFFEKETIEKILPQLINAFTENCGWNSETVEKNVKLFEEESQTHSLPL